MQIAARDRVQGRFATESTIKSVHKDRRALTALPVFNEVGYVNEVLDEVGQYSDDVLVVDDGSSDGTSELLAKRDDIRLVTHKENRGYGAALRTAFDYASENGFEVIVTIDCDGQHEPQRIPSFVAACIDVDIVSGSRYLKRFPGDSQPPAQRRWVNQLITDNLNNRLGFSLTDTFCGFKAYKVEAQKTEPDREWLCNAARTLGRSGGSRSLHRGIAGTADLSRRKPFVWWSA